MKNIMLYFLLFLLSLEGIAQTPSFNKTIIFSDTMKDEYLYQVIEVNDGYLLAGNVFTIDQALNIEYIALAVVKIDRQGNILKKRIYGDTSHSFQCPPFNSFVRRRDSSLVLPLTTFRNSHDAFQKIRLMKLTTDGDSIGTMLVHDSAMDENPSIVLGMVQAQDNGYGIFGDIGGGGSSVFKTDSTGRILWTTTVQCDYGYFTSQNSIFPLPDNGFLVGYHCQLYSGGYGYISRLDSAGAVLWSDITYGSEYEDAVMALSTNDSSYFGFSTVENNQDLMHKPFVIFKGDNTGVTLWTKKTGPCNHRFSAAGNVRLADSTWLGCGFALYGNYYDTVAWIFNYTDSANELFYKEFTPPAFPRTKASGPPPSWGFYSSIPTSDDGLLTIGFLWENSSSYNRPWIIKTDRYGCSEQGCDPDAIYLLLQPQSMEICQEDSAVFAFSITGDSINLQWQIRTGNKWQDITEGFDFIGSHSNILRLFHSGGMEGVYPLRCKIGNNKYTVYTAEALLKVNAWVSITKQPANQLVHLNDSARFDVSVSGSKPVSYQWYKDTTAISGAIDSIYTILSVQMEDTLIPYKCKVSNMCNEQMSEVAHVVISFAGLRQSDDPREIRLYPNPAHDKINLRLPAGTMTTSEVRILDLQGRPVRSFISGKQEITLDLKNILPGAYLVEITGHDGNIYRKVVIW